MYKVISLNNLIQHAIVVNNDGQHISVCIPPRGEVISKEITKSLEHLKEDRMVIISKIEDVEISEDSKTNLDTGSFSDNLVITEKQPQPKKRRHRKQQSNTSEEKSSDKNIKEEVDSNDNK